MLNKLILALVLSIGTAAHACDKEMEETLLTHVKSYCNGNVDQFSYFATGSASMPGITIKIDPNSKGYIYTFSCKGSTEVWTGLTAWVYDGDYNADVKNNTVDPKKCLIQGGVDTVAKKIML